MSKIVQKIKDKVAYEKESWQMSQQELKEILAAEKRAKGGK